MIWPIEGVVKDYAWGRPGALSDVLGRRVSDGVEAEWWLGAHPLGPSRAFDDHTPIALLLASQGAPALGFLFKILTPGSPLSLQVHPSPAQARAGFDRENDQGIPRDAPGRHYKDPFAKPELVVAWGGPFHALAGIRPLHEIRAVLSDLEDGGVDPMLLSCWRTSLDRGVSSAVTWLLGGGPEVADLLDELGRHCDRVEILERLWRHYPSDPGVAVALMMNRITLEPG